MTSSLLGLTGCATTTGIAETKVFCASARSITWSSSDTDQTIKEVKAHNAVVARLCGKKL